MRVADERDTVGDGLERPLQAEPGGGLARRYGVAAGPRSGCRRRRGRGRTGGRARSRRAAGPGPGRRARRRRRRRSGRARAGRSTRRSARRVRRPRCAAVRAPGGLPVVGRPTWSGVMRARRVVRNSRTSWRLSTPSSLGRRRARDRSREGCPVSTPIDSDFQPRPAQRVHSMSWRRVGATTTEDKKHEEEPPRCVR